MSKTIFISGGAGYIGSRMTGILLDKGYKVKVMDRCFFGNFSLKKYFSNPNFELLIDDNRYFDKSLLKGVDVVIDLAAISNDPACDLDPKATETINYKGTVRTATLAKEMGVKKYILSSSCSMYGFSENVLDENSPFNPVSLYAEMKIAAEKDILRIADDNFCVTFLRNSTVYGYSPRMRFDLVINMMTYHAWKNRKIFITGGGEQWRPLLHIEDCINAFILAFEADPKIVNKQAFNVGSSDENYQVMKMANIVKSVLTETEIVNVPEDPDRRSYHVNFDKIKKVLGFKPKFTVADGVKEVREYLDRGLIDYTLETRTVEYYKWLMKANRILERVKYKGKLLI